MVSPKLDQTSGILFNLKGIHANHCVGVMLTGVKVLPLTMSVSTFSPRLTIGHTSHLPDGTGLPGCIFLGPEQGVEGGRQ